MSQEIDVFDPEIHLVKPDSISNFTFDDLGLSNGSNDSVVAGSHPFPFLTKEGVLAYRRSILRPEVLDNCARWLGNTTAMLRNPASKSKFVTDLWTSPATTEIVRKALNMPVDIIMPMEIGHTNIQVMGDDCSLDRLTAEPSLESMSLTDEELSYDPLSAGSVIPWHFDSYPYVCIIMLSDTRSMTGGHTYLRTGDGSPHKVEGPAMGTAVVLQGGQVEHLASRAFGSAERITTISSYKVADVGTWDNSLISNVRVYDRLPDLYKQWSLYRLKKMREEIEAVEEKLRSSSDPGDPFPHSEVTALCSQLSQYSARTTRQMIPIAMRDEAVSKFSARTVTDAKDVWKNIREQPGVHQRVVDATSRTAKIMPEMKDYLLDWYQTKARLAIAADGGHDSLRVPLKASDEYYFPDELVRQGLNELLLLWLDKMEVL